MTTQAHKSSHNVDDDLIGPRLENNAFYFNIPHSREKVTSPYSTSSLGRVAVIDADSELRTTLTTPDSAQHLHPETGELLVTPEDAPHISTLETKEKSKKKLFISIGAGAAGLAVAAGAFTLSRGSSTPVTQSAPSVSGTPTPGPSNSEATPTPTSTSEVSPTDLPTLTETRNTPEALKPSHSLEELKSMDLTSFEKTSRGDKLFYYSWLTRDRDEKTKGLMAIDQDKNNLLATPSAKNTGQEVLNWNRFDVNQISLFSFKEQADGGLEFDNEGAIKALGGFIYNSGSNNAPESELYANVKGQLATQTERVNPRTVYEFVSEERKVQRDSETGKDITIRSIIHKNLTGSGEATYVTDFTLVDYTDYKGKAASAWMLVDSRDK